MVLRRARLDEPIVHPKCPNTPEMRRKFQPETLRAISVDRKPVRTNEIQSRYLLNLTKKPSPAVTKVESTTNVRNVPKSGCVPNKVTAASSAKPQVFSRTDSGRFSMRTSKPPASGAPKNAKKDGGSGKFLFSL